MIHPLLTLPSRFFFSNFAKQSIFENCIMGVLRSKTRILVTHQLDLLSSADQVCLVSPLPLTPLLPPTSPSRLSLRVSCAYVHHQIVVLKDGNVVDHGNYSTLMSTSEEFSRLIKTHVEIPEEAPQEGSKKKKKEKENAGSGEARGMKEMRGM